MKVQVLFGSQSDERVYGPLCRSLEVCGSVKMEVASAHRNPERVREIVTDPAADIFVAGAGLAAHLPGVVASLTQKPVFGVAVNGAFAGLDAFLSIVQMPKGVPVLAVLEDNSSLIAPLIQSWRQLPTDKIYLHWNRNLQNYSPIEKALQDMETLSQLKVEWAEVEDERCYGEIVTPWELPKGNKVNLFLCEKEQLSSSQLALDFMAKARHGGAWVGANNIQNYINQLQKIFTLKESVWN